MEVKREEKQDGSEGEEKPDGSEEGRNTVAEKGHSILPFFHSAVLPFCHSCCAHALSCACVLHTVLFQTSAMKILNHSLGSWLRDCFYHRDPN